MTRRALIWPAVALVVLIIELGATVGGMTGESFSPVDGWGPTRQAGALTFVIVVLGCTALALFDRFPLAAAAVATASYVSFALLGHELGMFLPPMAAVLGLMAQTRHRLVAILAAGANLVAGLAWVAARIDTITEPGVALLASIAFGSVLAGFFGAPVLVGEIVRTRSLLRRARRSAAPGAGRQ